MSNRKNSELRIYQAQSREGVKADAEGRSPKLIRTVEDIQDEPVRIRTSHVRFRRTKEKDALLAIGHALVGMAIRDLTSAEKTIFQAMVQGGWLEDRHGAVEWNWSRRGTSKGMI